MRSFILSLLLIAPCSTHAAVTISEIAWMGSAESANDEWIELYNSGEGVSLDGWRLTDGVNLSIPLSGTVASNAYAVLERTDDTSAAGTAFLIYTGALANTGSTLYLYRADNALEDQVAGGENWENIGGNNETKETAQKTMQGWRTGTPTPGQPNSGSTSAPEHDEEEENEDVHTETPKSSHSDPVSIELQVPDVTLSLDPRFPEVVYVNQNVVFDVVSSGLGKTSLDSLGYTWNFGDLTIQNGKRVTHTYRYPGEYVVTVHAAFGRHEQVSRKTIAVLPITFSLSKTSAGDVLLQNNAKYEVNISGFTLKGGTQFVFPERSIILAQGTITIPKEELGAVFVPVELYDQKGQVVASTVTPAPVSDAVFEEPSDDFSIELENVESLGTSSSNFSFVGEVTDERSQENAKNTDQLALLPEAAPIEKTDAFGETLPLLGLAGIVTLGIIAVFLGKRKEE